MNTLPPSSRRQREALLEQLPVRLGELFSGISSTARRLARDAARGCLSVTDEYLLRLREKEEACREFEDCMLLWRNVVNMEVAVSGDDWDEYPLPVEPEEIYLATQSIYCASRDFDRHSKCYEESDEPEDRLLAPLLWDCGTVCDRMVAHLGTLCGTGATVAEVRMRRPERPVVLRLSHHNHHQTIINNPIIQRPMEVNGNVIIYGNNIEHIEHYYEHPDRLEGAEPPEKAVKNISTFVSRSISETHVLAVLHRLIDGKKGKEVALVVQCAMERGWFSTKPTFNAMALEFGDIGNESGFNRYMRFDFTEKEKNPILEQLVEMKE
jgi:hypothetical protein